MIELGHGELGRKLFAIMREHGLPEHTTRFTVTVAVDELVTVNCDFIGARVDEPPRPAIADEPVFSVVASGDAP